MSPSTLRRLRAGLVVLALGVVVAVALTIRRSPGRPENDTSPSPDAASTKPVMIECMRRQLPENGREFVLKASRCEGSDQEELRMKQVDLLFTYSKEGKLEKGTILADEAIYVPTKGTAVFQGHVKLTTADGLVMTTESLAYDEKAGSARSTYPVAFSRKDVSGSGKGLLYDSVAGTMQLDEDAHVVIADEKEGATDIRSRRALVNRGDHTVRFIGDVIMTRRSDELRSGELTVNFNEEGNAVVRAEAIDDVHLKVLGAQELGPVDVSGGQGLREVQGQQLDLWFRPDHTLERMEAGPDGVLVLHPGPTNVPEVKRLAARLLTFLFDEAGRLAEVQGHRDSSFVTERKDKRGGRRTMTCQNFVAQFDPASGELDVGDFSKDVKFSWPEVEATAQKARFERSRAPGGLLMLKESPELHELKTASRLTAQVIDMEPETRNVKARHGVRHVIPPHPNKTGGLVGAGTETVITCRFFTYDAEHLVGVYREEALLRSGKDELRADEITAEDWGRKITATGQVVSILHPKSVEKEKEPVAVEARARNMVYDERVGRIDYEGDVVMRHGEVTTKSPRSVVVLTPDGRDFQRLEASSRVLIAQGKRQATGDSGVYVPADKTVTLEGHVGLKDDQGQTLRGRRLTFRLDEETVRLEGREEARTETVLQKTPGLP